MRHVVFAKLLFMLYLQLTTVVLGRFGKTAISLPFILGFERAIYQTKGNSFLYHAVKTRLRLDVFRRTYELKSYFFTFIFRTEISDLLSCPHLGNSVIM